MTIGPKFNEPETGLMELLGPFLPTARALDIGAHSGDVSERLLAAGYEVYAFEPNPPIFESLVERLGGRANFHPFRLALGRREGMMPLYLADDLSGYHRYADPTLLSSLAIHGILDDLGYTRSIPVEVKSIESLCRSGIIPEDISLVKIDTEGYDLEVIRGMEDLRYPFVAAEFWDREILWGRSGLAYSLENLVSEMRNRGYSRHLVIYRLWGRNEIWYALDATESVANSWGNAFFFQDPDLFGRAARWCSTVLPLSA